MKRLIVLAALVILPLPLTGCAGNRTVTEHSLIREGMDQATRTIRVEHKEWSKFAHEGKPLPKLSDFDLKNRMEAHKAYEDLVTSDRERDKK